ncbi:gas vesicle protein GvpJ [Geodermatophilus ruber]|uniref:Gas vesicle protein A n=1 Tax=Geodermatophilus ruber TaxID=504800 RepID=A0A1I4GSF3_9ACTN|nr:gas vesicle protein GvpJ [Geodermatophilus ruber]SFL32091.1 Gas vesicle protein [Geodermatophilus ruber]
MTAALAKRDPRPSGLADVLDLILDKGLVIDVYARIAVVGIELLTIDARVVIASVDTYLRFAEAVNRLDIRHEDQVAGVPGLLHEMTEGVASSKARGVTKGAASGVREKAAEAVESVLDRGSGGSSGPGPPAQRRPPPDRGVPEGRDPSR